MPIFLVHIEMQIGEYEKNTCVLVEAPDEDRASIFALACESHGHARIENECGLVWWDRFGEMAYTVYRMLQVSESVAGTLKALHFNLLRYDEDSIRPLLKDPEELDKYLGTCLPLA